MLVNKIKEEIEEQPIKFFSKIVQGWNHGGDDKPTKGF